jgi:pyruvate dehydrogenase E2 component (dihydrolipoamide acetyltransferase)
MVRLARLAVVLAALACAAPAQADSLPADLGNAAVSTVQQAPAAAVTTVAQSTTTVRETAAAATAPIRPAMRQTSATTAAAAPTTGPAVKAATDLAEPAEQPATYTTAGAVHNQADGSAEVRAGVSSTPPDGSAHLVRQRGHRSTGAGAAQQGPRAALAHPAGAAPPPATAPADVAGAPLPAHASKRHPAAPDRLPPTGGGTTASAPAAGLALGGLALLAIAVSLAGPRLQRRLLIRPASLRPVAFVSLLERPG